MQGSLAILRTRRRTAAVDVPQLRPRSAPLRLRRLLTTYVHVRNGTLRQIVSRAYARPPNRVVDSASLQDRRY